MTDYTYRPDEMPPGARRLIYGVFCWFNRNTTVLRAIGALLRRWPQLGNPLGLVARAGAVKQVLTRPNSFTNTSHAPNLVTGNYLISMDPGPTYAADRALIAKRLAALNVPADADKEAQQRAPHLQSLQGGFDVIDDYLIWVVFRAMEPLFGTAARRVTQGTQGNADDAGLQREYMMEIRYVAAQLIGGSSSPLPVRRRAEVCGDALKSRIRTASADINKAWNGACPAADIERNAVGLAWVSHPVTVQSAALIVQELLRRPTVYAQLRARAKGVDVWNDEAFRGTVRDHVLELMRFRPVFPLLVRDVPRDTEVDTGARSNAACPAGSHVSIWSIAALFDSEKVPNANRFDAGREWGHEQALRYLMFGYGSRQCPARDHAIEIMTSALIGLLTLPELCLATEKGRKAIEYDGPLMAGMRLRFK